MEEKFDSKTRRVTNLGFCISLILGVAAILSFGDHLNPFSANSVTEFITLLFAIKYQILGVVAAVTIMILSLHIQQVEHRRLLRINRPYDVKPTENVMTYGEITQMRDAFKQRQKDNPQ